MMRSFLINLPAFTLGVLYIASAFLRVNAARWNRPLRLLYRLSVPLALALAATQFWFVVQGDSELRAAVARMIAVPWVLVTALLPALQAIKHPIDPTPRAYAHAQEILRRASQPKGGV